MHSLISMESWDKFVRSSSINGLRNTAMAKTLSMRVFWYTLMSLAVIVCMYSTVRNTNDYLKYKVTTRVSTKNYNETEFPSISFQLDHFLDRTHMDPTSFNGFAFYTNAFTNQYERTMSEVNSSKLIIFCRKKI